MGKYDRIEWRRIAGAPAATATVRKDMNALRILTVLKNRRLNPLTYAGPPGSAGSAAAVRFTQSFRLKL